MLIANCAASCEIGGAASHLVRQVQELHLHVKLASDHLAQGDSRTLLF